MVKRPIVLAASLLLLASACGSSRHGSIARPVAQRLAAESDAVAAALRGGDGCRAAALAQRLRSDVAAAGLPEQARLTAARIAAEIVCVPPAPAAPVLVPQDHGHGNGHGHGHHDHGGDGGGGGD